MRSTLTSVVRKPRTSKKVGAVVKPHSKPHSSKAPVRRKADIVVDIVSTGYALHTAKQLSRMTVKALDALLGTLKEALDPKPVVVCVPSYVATEADLVMVDTSCAASVLATQELPVAQHAEPLPLPVATFAEPLPVARLAEPKVVESGWSVFGKCVASFLAAPLVIASLPIIVGLAIGAVLVAHMVEQI